MATAFRRPRRGGGDTVVATLDESEREVVSALMLQTRELLAPPDPVDEPVAERDHERDPEGKHEQDQAPVGEPHQTADAFDEIVATLDMDETDEPGPRADGTAPPAAADGGPRDPALDRLIPAANRDDPAAAAEFRRLTEHGLRRRKVDNLTVALEALAAAGSAKDKVVLDPEQAQAFLIALVDVRLVLGERLGLRTDEDADALHGYLAHATLEDPRATMAAYYDFLTWLQESLTQALMKR